MRRFVFVTLFSLVSVFIVHSLFVYADGLRIQVAEPLDAAFTYERALRTQGVDRTRDAWRMPRGGMYITNEVLVKYANNPERFSRIIIPHNSVQEHIAQLQKRGDVIYAEPNYKAYALWQPNDPYYSLQWNLDNSTTGGIAMEEAWEYTGAPGQLGNNTVVAVIDTGVAYENYLFYKQASDLSGTCFVQGYDFVNNDTHANDDDGHGTHVAGTIAQSTHNSNGVAGIAFKACVMPVKVLDANGAGTYADIANGIYFAVDNGAKVINLSIGGPVPSQVLEDALAYAYAQGVTVVAAAGNDGQAGLSYPAAYNNYVIAVGATRFDNTRAYYSNYGAGLDIMAPGGDITIDQNGDGYGDGILQQTLGGPWWNPGFGYYFYQGTSMAAPHVAGVATLVISNGNATTPNDVRAALQESATDLGPAGYDTGYGHGLVHALGALRWNSGPIDNPPSVTITQPSHNSVVSGNVNITAAAQDDNGVSKVEFYINSSLIGSDSLPPYSTTLNTTLYADGQYTLTSTAYDTANQTVEDTVDISIDNVNNPPVALAGPDQSAYVNDTVTVDGSLSYDTDGTIVSYVWDFGDGAQASTAIAQHTYTQAGVYTVTLTVADHKGAEHSDTLVVTVQEKPQTPTLHVEDINFTYQRWGYWGSPRCRVSAYVTVRDSSNQIVPWVSVNGHWSGAYTGQDSGSADFYGVKSFSTKWVRGCGTFTFTVDGIQQDGYVYDQSANTITSKSITIN